MKRVVLSIVLFSLLIVGVIAQAQDATTLQLGEIVQGELTSTTLEENYTINVEEGDFVLVEIRSAPDSSLYSPAVRVIDPNGDVVADSTQETGGVGRVAFIAEEGGDYGIIGTRSEYSSDTGTYLLRAMVLETLESDATVSGNVSNETYDAYYAIPSDTVMELTYQQTNGQYIPTFRVSLVDEMGVLRTIANAGAIDGIVLSMELETDDDYLYVVSVVANDIDYEFDEIDSDFDLTMTAE